jgi:hypothetical protein
LALIYRNGRPRLQRSVRIGGRVTSRYVASGPLAELLDAQTRRLRIAEAGCRGVPPVDPEERKRLDELERALDALVADARGLAHAALAAAGYHQHKRGEWRRCRGHRN